MQRPVEVFLIFLIFMITSFLLESEWIHKRSHDIVRFHNRIVYILMIMTRSVNMKMNDKKLLL